MSDIAENPVKDSKNSVIIEQADQPGGYEGSISLGKIDSYEYPVVAFASSKKLTDEQIESMLDLP